MTDKEAAAVQRKVRALRAHIERIPATVKVGLEPGPRTSLSGFADAQAPFDFHGYLPDCFAFLETRVGFSDEAGDLPDGISLGATGRMLRMSRPSIIRLIENGILHTRTGPSRARLSRAEVVAFQEEHTLPRQQALEKLTAMSDEFDF